MKSSNLLLLKKELNLETNRERQVPVSLDDVEITHKVRYLFIRNKILEIYNKKNNNFVNINLLDYGCGSGYGCYILNDVAMNVFGFDIDQSCIDYAKQAFICENIFYTQNPKYVFNQKFEIISCVEMIEHISLNEGFELLKKMYDLLNEDGILFLTTPRRPYGNPYHIYEYTYDEMYHYLKKSGFKKIESYGQVYDLIDKHENLLEYYKNREKYTMIFVCKK